MPATQVHSHLLSRVAVDLKWGWLCHDRLLHVMRQATNYRPVVPQPPATLSHPATRPHHRPRPRDRSRSLSWPIGVLSSCGCQKAPAGGWWLRTLLSFPVGRGTYATIHTGYLLFVISHQLDFKHIDNVIIEHVRMPQQHNMIDDDV